MSNRLKARRESFHEHQQGTDHHTCSAFACFAMDGNSWRFEISFNFLPSDSGGHASSIFTNRILPTLITLLDIKLLRLLQEKVGIHAKVEHLFQITNIVVTEWEATDWAPWHLAYVVLFVWFSTQIVNFNHIAVIFMQKRYYIFTTISIIALHTGRRVPAS